MSAKNNLNKAMFDMFGVGKEEDPKAVKSEGSKPAAAGEKTSHKADAHGVRPTGVIGGVSPSTYIAPSMVIEGNIKTKGDIEIAGTLTGDVISEGMVTVRSTIKGNISGKLLHLIDCVINGDIKSSGDVIISEGSVVNGNIDAKSVSCSGKINGNVVAAGNISLDASARVDGNITAVTMVVARGASIKGNIFMGSDN